MRKKYSKKKSVNRFVKIVRKFLLLNEKSKLIIAPKTIPHNECDICSVSKGLIFAQLKLLLQVYKNSSANKIKDAISQFANIHKRYLFHFSKSAGWSRATRISR